MNARAAGPQLHLILMVTCIVALASVGCRSTGGFAVNHGQVEVATPGGGVSVVFSDGDERLIREYYTANKGGHPGRGRGKAKGRRGLPPGIAKNLERGKPIPPGLRDRPLPLELDSKLQRLPEGYIRVRVGGSVVIKDVKTDVIVDIVRGIGD